MTTNNIKVTITKEESSVEKVIYTMVIKEVPSKEDSKRADFKYAVTAFNGDKLFGVVRNFSKSKSRLKLLRDCLEDALGIL